MGKDEKQALVYVMDPEFAWLPATLLSNDGKKAKVSVPIYKTEQAITSDGGRGAIEHQERTILLKDYAHGVLPLQNTDNNGMLLEFADMVQLPYLHEAAILYNLKRRHQTGNPYTRTGDIIIAVNPFQWFTELYTEKKRVYYSNRLVWEDHENDPREGMEPHVYEVSALSYKGLAFTGNDQSILVSGESGAGKTETVKIAMNHMASVQKGPSSSSGEELDPVVKRVVESNPLLEAYGNAKTRRNDNSSRFGKYLQLQFDNSEASLMAFGDKSESKCKLAGSTCEVYLLEKNRVVGHDPEERTYHCFYQLIAAPDDVKGSFWSKMKGTTNDSFKYIGHTNTTTIEGMSDAQHFARTVEVLDMIKVNGDKLKEMMRAICAVLVLGNLTFAADGDPEKSKCTSPDAMKDLAELVGVSEQTLSLSFTERTMRAKGETYKISLRPEFAKDACDALAREIYGKLFLWLVQQVNAATRAEDNYKDGTMTKFGIVGMLDIFGFESFVVNRFDQLCINYANEKLQQKFTEDIFRSVQAEYESEGIELAEIWYDDNTDVLDLIEGRTGLLAMLNEECVRPKGSDQDFVQKALQQNKDSPCMIINKMDRMSFGIHHFAGKVMYDADGFVQNNNDILPTDLSELCMQSTNFVIASDMSAAETPAGGRVAPKRQKSNLVAPTVWGKYKTQLQSLMISLRKTQSRYIRCIKPNMAKKPILMEHVPTMEQLRCAGVVAAVTLSRSAFPNRLDNAVCRYRYASMWDPNAYPSKRDDSMTKEEGLRCDCDAILSCALKEKEETIKGKVSKAFVVGRTRSYFRAGALEFLESTRLENGLDAPATKIQKLFRGFYIRKNWDILVSGARQEEERKRLEEERRIAEEKRRKEEAERKKKEEEERKIREAKAAHEKAEREAREARERAEKLKREREEQRRREEEEREEQNRINAIKKEIKGLEKELEEKKKKNKKKLKKAQDELEEFEAERAKLEAKLKEIMAEASKIPSGDIDSNKKKLEESEKIVAFLRKENKKVRDSTEKMQEDLLELREQNNRLVEANASAGASLDSLSKQKKNIAIHNERLAESLRKYKDQNTQLKSDLENRNAYFKAETKIRAEYEKAMDQIVDIVAEKSSDSNLIEEVTNAQMQCQAIAAQKLESCPGLANADFDP